MRDTGPAFSWVELLRAWHANNGEYAKLIAKGGRHAKLETGREGQKHGQKLATMSTSQCAYN